MAHSKLASSTAEKMMEAWHARANDEANQRYLDDGELNVEGHQERSSDCAPWQTRSLCCDLCSAFKKQGRPSSAESKLAVLASHGTRGVVPAAANES